MFTPEDDRTPGGHYVAVLSHSYWTNRLGARPEVLNQPILVNGYSMTVVGVAPKGFYGDTLGRPIDVFVPITMKAQMTPKWNGMGERKDYWVTPVGRLKPGMTMERAAEAINSPFHAMQQDDAKLLNHPDKKLLDRFLNKRIVLKHGSSGRGWAHQGAARPLALLIGITAFVLLIACANAANLLLARAAGRRKEIAIRLSVGASRARLVRQLLLESWMLSLSGGLLGLLVAQWTLDVLISFIPSTELSGFINSQLDGRVLLYCLAVSLVTGLAFGLYPALQATKPDVAPTLKDHLTPAAKGSSRYFRDSGVIAQVALSLMLLVTAGLFAASLVKMTRIDVGFSSDRLMTFSLRPEFANYNRERTIALFEQLEDRLAAVPGVRMVSAAEIPLIAATNTWNNITVEGYTSEGEADRNAYLNEVGPAFFATLGIPLVAGREFTRADSMNAPKVAIINQTFAKRYFEYRNPLGRHFMFAAAFACLATLLASIGLYGVLAYTVARRTHEIGIRMALGADGGDIHRLILREVLVILGIGIGIGSAAAVAANRLFESLLYGVKSTDPAVLLGAAVLLAAVALVAGNLPARKATEVDPIVALRY
ncbi:MAG: ABC transporter permease [Bryobacterales bacterium]|nr:ABC transporter permease [Bryobacterales bacterium]